MKRYIINILLIPAIAFLLVGCYGEDENEFLTIGKHTLSAVDFKVNGELIPVDTFAVNAIYSANKKSIIVESGDMIDIVLKSEFTSGFDPIYHWEIFEYATTRDLVTNEFPPVIPLGDTKDISFEMKGAPVEHILRCIITNRTNLVEDVLFFSIKISKPSGYAVLYETDKGGDFDFFKSSSNTINQAETVFFRNIFSSTNNRYINNPKTLAINGATLLSFNNDNILSMNSNTYKVTNSETSNFFLLFAPPFTKAGFYNSGAYGYAVLDGEIYFTGSGFKFKSSITPGVKYNSSIIVNEGMGVNNSLWVFFNESKKSFQYGNFNGGINTFVSDASSLFDINNTQMDLLYAETGNNNYVNAVMKDASNKYFFCELDLKYEGTGATQQKTVKAVTKTDITNLTGYSESSKWAMHLRAPFAFYSSGTNIYKYNQDTNQSTVFTTISGEVTLMKVFRSSNEAINSRTLYVATYDAGKGYLYEINYDVLAGTIIGQINKYDFGGRIIDLKYI